jgi:hypothetical protein
MNFCDARLRKRLKVICFSRVLCSSENVRVRFPVPFTVYSFTSTVKERKVESGPYFDIMKRGGSGSDFLRDFILR